MHVSIEGLGQIEVPEIVESSTAPIEQAIIRVVGAPLLARTVAVQAAANVVTQLLGLGMYDLVAGITPFGYCPECFSKAVDTHVGHLKSQIAATGSMTVVRENELIEIATRLLYSELYGHVAISVTPVVEVIIIDCSSPN